MIKKSLSITIGYDHYLLSEKDAIRMLAIASRATKIERSNNGWQGPFREIENGEPFVTCAELVEVEYDDPADSTDAGVHLQAARNLP